MQYEERVQSIKQQIVDVVKVEYRKDMVNLFEGNVSVRLKDRVFITPSQVNKESMTPDLIIETDLAGNVIHVPVGQRPTSELRMHLRVYELRPDVRAVVHNHSVFATAFAMNHMPLKSDALTEMALTVGEVPVVPYGKPGSDDICKAFPEYIGQNFALLLANHGVLTFGADLEAAFANAEMVEKLAKTILVSKLLGMPVGIPQDEMTAMLQFSDSVKSMRVKAALQKIDELGL